MLCDIKVSAAPAALDIPELLRHIISFIKWEDLVNAARINRYWSEHALSTLWEHLPELIFLVRILHPLRWSEEDEYWVLAEGSSGADWTRYEFYAHRIRTLSHSDCRCWGSVEDYGYHLSPEVLVLFSSRGPLPPRVESFHFGVRHDARDLAFLPRLLHSNIKRLEIDIDVQCDEELVRKMFGELSHVPGLQLKAFNWSLTEPRNHEIPVAAASFLEHQQTMEDLGISECQGPSPRMIQGIIQLSNLRSLSIEWQGSTFMGRINPAVSRLSEGCPLLRELRLSYIIPSSFHADTPFDFNNLYKWGLEVLEIGIESPADARLSVGDIRKMGAAWPNLRIFKVNWENPLVGDEPGFGLPLSTLNVMAKQWPNIQELNTVFEWTEDLADTPTARFSALRELPASEWYIPEDKVGEVAGYLKALRIDPKALRHAGPGRQYIQDDDLQDRYERSRDRWRAVASMML